MNALLECKGGRFTFDREHAIQRRVLGIGIEGGSKIQPRHRYGVTGDGLRHDVGPASLVAQIGKNRLDEPLRAYVADCASKVIHGGNRNVGYRDIDCCGHES